MCTMSMVMDWGMQQPRQWWVQPYVVPGFEELLRKAREYDRLTGQPDCELDEKRKALKKIAAELGVEITFP